MLCELLMTLVWVLSVVPAILSVIPGIQTLLQNKTEQYSGSFELYYPTGISRFLILAIYIYIAYSFFTIILGLLLDLLELLSKVALFGFFEEVPPEAINCTSWWIMLALGIIGIVLSFIGYPKKDIRVVST